MRGADRREAVRSPWEVARQPRDEHHGHHQQREEPGDEDQQRLELLAGLDDRRAGGVERAGRQRIDARTDDGDPVEGVAQLSAGALDVPAAALEDPAGLGEARDRVMDAHADDHPERHPGPCRQVGDQLTGPGCPDLAVELEHPDPPWSHPEDAESCFGYRRVERGLEAKGEDAPRVHRVDDPVVPEPGRREVR